MAEKQIPCVLDPSRPCHEFCGLRNEAELYVSIVQEIFPGDEDPTEQFIAEFKDMPQADKAFLIMNFIDSYEESNQLDQCLEYTLSTTKDAS